MGQGGVTKKPGKVLTTLGKASFTQDLLSVPVGFVLVLKTLNGVGYSHLLSWSPALVYEALSLEVTCWVWLWGGPSCVFIKMHIIFGVDSGLLKQAKLTDVTQQASEHLSYHNCCLLHHLQSYDPGDGGKTTREKESCFFL